MTSSAALLMAFAFLVNDCYILYDKDVLKNKYLNYNLVYLISTCLILKHINIFPWHLRKHFSLLCTLFEVPFAIGILEISLYHIWKCMQDYLYRYADDLLVHLTEEKGLDWLICRICYHQSNCSAVFAALVLKIECFAILLAVYNIENLKIVLAGN
ncbi:hypothetical protein K1T71_013170 [Dendrolimus kikuchii]|uniref:Uncharacterized protein n=1 Tax=Dendrolimus kikuchii TaxID=765133 RepID=A0ACC1CJ50_9NEOP|nr:hypothetical protein K1T71_013170 [Dendrolimus kikuchii]